MAAGEAAGPAPDAVLLPPGIAAAIRAAAEAAWPEEACGLLAGRRDGARLGVTRAVPCANLAADRRRAFEIDPQAWLDLRAALARETGAGGGGEDIVGCWHSHPDGRAGPSPRDLAAAWEPGFLWLVVAVRGGRAAAPTAHLFEADGPDLAQRRFRRLAVKDG